MSEQLETYPGSPQQRRFADVRESRAALCTQWCVEFEFPREPALLRKSLATLVDGSDALRSELCSDGCVATSSRQPLQWREVPQDVDTEELSAALRTEDSSAELTRVGAWVDPATGRTKRVLLTIPAQLADLRSSRLIVEDWLELITGRTPSSDRIHYSEYAEWLNVDLQSELQDGRRFWESFGRSEVHPTQLPGEMTGANDRAFRVESIAIPLDEEARIGLEALTRQREVSIEELGLAIWHGLLSWMTGADTVAIAVFHEGREFDGGERALGPFETVLPFRTKANAEASLVSLAGAASAELAVMTEWAEAWTWQGAGADPRDLPAYAFEPTSRSFDDREARAKATCLYSCREQFRARLVMRGNGKALEAELEFDGSRLVRAEAEGLAAQLGRLFRSWPAQAETPMRQLPPLSDAERLTLAGWNDTRSSLSGKTAHEHFEAWAERTPEALAVSDHQNRLTYQELNSRANRLARALLAQGVQREHRVAIFTPRSAEWVVSVLAVLKSGGAFVPLDPASPARRLTLMLDDAKPTCIITTSALVDQLPHGDWPVLLADREEHFESDASNLGLVTYPSQLAYVIFTSGSTGVPKGVEIEVRGLSNLVEWTSNGQLLAAGERCSQVSAPGFDASIWEVAPPLISGASVWVVPDEIRSSAALLWKWFSENSIHVAFVPTPIAEGFLREAPQGEGPLRILLTGGDKLHRGDWNALPFEVRNQYGPTEAAVVATWSKLDDPIASWMSPSIGRPISNVSLFILDEELKQVPLGVPGELCIGGIGLARGYLNRPDLTEQAFVSSPLAEEGRIYRTGDLARYRPDGQVEFLGRKDNQVQIRGLRVELEEIEVVLSSLEGVRESAVIARPTGTAGKQLVAFLVMGESEPLDSKVAQRSLEESLPEYMVPRRYVQLDELPLNASGKVDRRTLLELPLDVREEAVVEARSEEEEILVEIWRSVLELEVVGTHDNFFELGGDSIMTVQVANQARQRGLEISPKLLLEHQTIAEIASVASTDEERSLASADEGGPIHLSPGQAWHLQLEQPDSDHYNMAVHLAGREPTDMGCLEAAIEHVCSQHEALRLRFERRSGRWHQEISEPDELPLTQIDVSDLPLNRQDEAIAKTTDELHRTLSAADARLIRFAHFQRGEALPGHLVVVAHHLVADAVSLRVVLEDLATAYLQLRQGERVVSGRKTSSFAAWTRALGDFAAETSDDELPHWAAVLAVPTPTIGRNDDPDEDVEANSVVLADALSPAVTRRLASSVPQALRVSTQAALLTALGRALSHWTRPGEGTGPDDVRIDLSVSGRDVSLPGVDSARTVGWLSALAPIRLAGARVESLAEAARATERELSAMPSGGIGYAAQRHLGSKDHPTIASSTTSTVCFAYLGRTTSVPEAAPFAPVSRPVGLARSRRNHRVYPLEVIASIVDDAMKIELNFNSRRISSQGAGDLMALLKDEMSEIAELAARELANSRRGGGGNSPAEGR